MSTLNIQDSQPVFLVMNNTDRNEGRGYEYVAAVTSHRYTARRLGAGNYVQGTSCPIQTGMAYKIDGEWYVPGRVEKPNEKDLEQEARDCALAQALAKLKLAGVTDEELELIKSL